VERVFHFCIRQGKGKDHCKYVVRFNFQVYDLYQYYFFPTSKNALFLFREGIKITGILGEVNTRYELLLRNNKITAGQLVHGSHCPGTLWA